MDDRALGIKKITASELAALTEGDLRNADENLEISGLTALEHAPPGWVSFIVSPKHKEALKNTKASLVFVPKDFDAEGRPVIVLDNIWRGVKRAMEYFYPRPPAHEFIDPRAHIAEDIVHGSNLQVGPGAVIQDGVTLGDDVRIGANVFIGYGVMVGSHTIIQPNVTILNRTEIGARCLVMPGTVIGSEGFGYKEIDGTIQQIPQVGKVVIEDDVEIGANCTIDRGAFKETFIGQGTKIDNLVHVAHNCRVGRNSILCGQVGFAGSTEIGEGCILAGQVGLADNLKIGNRVILAAKSGVMDNVPDGETWFGIPAQPIKDTMKVVAQSRKLPELVKEFRQLKKQVAELIERREK